MSGTPDIRDIERFLFQEARLLDEHRYAAWVELFAEDGIYWVPSGKEGEPADSVTLIYDNKRRLKERLLRMGARTFWAQQPPTRTTRLIGNVTLEAERDGALIVDSRFIMTLLRRHEQRLLSGTTRYELLPADGSFSIRQKRVELLERDEAFDNLTFLL